MDNLLSLAGARNYLVALVVFLAIDMVWLLFIAKSLYSKYLGYLMGDKVNFGAAFLFYLIFILGLLFFVIDPALAKGSLGYAILAGALFGLVTYSTYDLTNMATIKDWPALITVVDLLWGSFVSSATASVSYLVIKMLFLKG
jgi:uncharacterized membrane protein